MNEIIDPVSPDVLNPAPHATLAGNHSDDDGQAIDEWFEAPSHEPQAINDLQRSTPPTIKAVPTRLISRAVSLDNNTSDPLMLFSADVNRRDLVIRCYGADPASVYVMVGSDKTDVYNSAFVNADGGTYSEWRTDKHTGAVWVYVKPAPGASPTGATEITAWSVTE